MVHARSRVRLGSTSPVSPPNQFDQYCFQDWISSCMSLATTNCSVLLSRQTISRLPLRLRNGLAVLAATTRLSPRTLLQAGHERAPRRPDVRGYASQPPPGGMGGIPNFLFQQPRQKGETLKEYVRLQNIKRAALFISFAERRPHRNGAQWEAGSYHWARRRHVSLSVLLRPPSLICMDCRNSQDNSKWVALTCALALYVR